VVFTASGPHGEEPDAAGRSRFVAELGVPWWSAPAPPFSEPLTVAEAAASWRRTLAERSGSAPVRLAALDGLHALGVDPARWWFQRAWTGLDRPLHETIRVSHTKLDSLQNCDLQFVLSQELGLEGRAGYHAWVGQLVHRLIEDCEHGLVERSAEALAAEALARWRPEQFPSLAVSEAFKRLVITVMLPAWVKDYGETPAVARELRFEFEFDGALVVGVIDRISAVQRGGSFITDYKTGRSRNAEKADDNLQLGMYYLAVNHAEELAPFRPVRGIELVFLRDVDWRSGEVKRAAKGFTSKEEPDYAERMSGRLSELVGRIRELQVSENYRPNPSADCMWCGYKSLCSLWPEGKELFSTEASDG
jgi:RecB family exonuclease